MAAPAHPHPPDSEDLAGLRRRLLVPALAVATGVGLLESAKGWTVNRLMGRPQTAARALEVNLPWWLLWAVLSVPIAKLTDRVPLARPFHRSIPVHAVASIVFSVVHLGLASAVIVGGPAAPAGYAMTFRGQFTLLSISYFFMELVTYWAIVGGYSAYVALERSRRAEEARRALALEAAEAEAERARLQRQMVEARLHALRTELNPHFLFNSLNGVAALAQAGDLDGAVTMVSRLGDLLRRTLDRDHGDEATVAEELELLGLYLAIERVRYGSRLRVREEVEPEAAAALMPPLLLQPLVENAIRHGVAAVRRPVDIVLRARVRDGRLELAVEDSGPGLADDGEDGGERRNGGGAAGPGGVGLRNVRERLETLYGPDGALTVRSRDAGAGGGVAARVTLPARRPSPARLPDPAAAGAETA